MNWEAPVPTDAHNNIYCHLLNWFAWRGRAFCSICFLNAQTQSKPDKVHPVSCCVEVCTLKAQKGPGCLSLPLKGWHRLIHSYLFISVLFLFLERKHDQVNAEMYNCWVRCNVGVFYWTPSWWLAAAFFLLSISCQRKWHFSNKYLFMSFLNECETFQ